MFCLKCGKEMENGAKFCPHCGAMTSSAAPAEEPSASSAPQAPVYTMPEANGAAQWSSPAPEGKKPRAGLFIGGITAAVLVVALVAALAGGLFSSPKGQVEKALAKTAAAYAGAAGRLGAPGLDELVQNKSYTQRVSFELDSVNQALTGGYDLSCLRGLGLRMDADYDQKGRSMDFDLGVFWDGEDLASIQMLVDDSRMTFSSPQFTKGDAYGLNTETLGADLVALGAWNKRVDLEQIGFNLFDLMDLFTPSAEQAKEARAAMAQAYKQLFDAVQVEKGGRQTVQVNGKSTDAVLYRVAIPEDALLDCIDAAEDAAGMPDVAEVMEEMFRSMGFDQDAIDEMIGEPAGDTDVYGAMFDSLRNIVEDAGDLELEVYVSGGYVCAAEYSQKADGSELKIQLYLGGGENYVDDLSLVISGNGDKISVESTGDHACKSGAFTDETVIRRGNDRVVSQLRYEPEAASGNFAWSLKVGGEAAFEMEGQLTTTKNSVELSLDDLSVKAMGARLASLKADYYLGPYEGLRVSHPSPKLLGDMDEEDLMDMAYDLEANAQEWQADMVDYVTDRVPPDLLDALW